MSTHSLIRIAAFLTVVAISVATSSAQFATLATIVAIAHSLLATLYSRRQFRAATSTPWYSFNFALLAVGAVAIYQTHAIPLVVLFLPHYLFNEVYLGQQVLFQNQQWHAKWLTRSALLLNTLLYCEIAHFHSWGSLHFSSAVVQPGIAIATCWFLLNVWSLRSELGIKGMIDAVVFESLGGVALVISCFYPTVLFHLVLYHIVFWTYYPFCKIAKAGKPGGTRAYVIWNIAAVVAVTLVHPVARLPWHFTGVQVTEIFVFTTICHILFSLATSKAQPDWIVRVFQPRSEPIPATAGGAISIPVIAGRAS